MFGREYTNHLDILTQSLEQMSKTYQKKTRAARRNDLVDKLKKLYISLFGIPEIGFQIRSIYFKKIISSYYLNNYPETILDAGSGIGAYTLWLGKKFSSANVIGGDIDQYKIKLSLRLAEKLKIKNVSFTYFDIKKVHKKSAYDLIVTIDVLEHINQYKLVLKNFYALLQNGGHLYIHVPQPNQKRIISLLQTWHHEDHVHEGITKSTLENKLKKLGFQIVLSKETFGFFGKLSWEINHLMLSRNFFLAGVTFPILFFIAKIDLLRENRDGLGVALLARKKD